MKKIAAFLMLFALYQARLSFASEDLFEIPSSVMWIYVFAQDSNSVARGSGEDIAAMITPEEFLKNFVSYRSQVAGKNRQLIVTAQTKDGNWVQDQITYKGKRLRPARYYNSGIDRVSPGAEIPIQ
jgi:hypothetical protein